MTQEQLMILVRDALKVGGTIATLLGVADGDISKWHDMVLLIAGPLTTLIAIFWSQMRHTAAGIISQASALPEVRSMTVTTESLAQTAKEADSTTRVQVSGTDKGH